MRDWNDLRYLVAVARHGSSLAAARALGVDQSTVQRRLLALEKAVGWPLVTRLPSGYRLTEFGQAMLPAAEAVERSVTAFTQAVAGFRLNAAGVIRLTCPEPLVERIARLDLSARFTARHPGLTVELVVSDRYLDLRTGEADVALRSGDTEDGFLIGRRLADSLWACYVSRSYAERQGVPTTSDELARHALVGFDRSMAGHRASRWLAEQVPTGRIVVRHSSVLGLLHSVKASVGVGLLPTALGDEEADLLRAFGPIPALTRVWRLLALPEVRRTPRVAAFFEFMVGEIEALRPILTG